MKKLKLQTDIEDFTSVGRATETLVNKIIDDAVNPKEPDMLRGTVLEGQAKQMLKNFVERWERIEEEKKAIAGDQAEVMKEAVSAGFDKEALSTLLKWRKKDAEAVKHTLGIVEVYHDLLGMEVWPG